MSMDLMQWDQHFCRIRSSRLLSPPVCNRFKGVILLKTSSDPLNMPICSMTLEEALSDRLRYRHFHCDLEGPNFLWWNRCVLSYGAAESLLMVTLETQRHCMHEKCCWQQCSYHVILRNWAKILIPPFTFLNLFDRHPTITIPSSPPLQKNKQTKTKKQKCQTLIWKEGNSVNFMKCYNVDRIKENQSFENIKNKLVFPHRNIIP